MGRNADGVAGLIDTQNEGITPSAWDRYGHWPRGLARLAIGIMALLLALAAWAPGMNRPPAEVPVVHSAASDHSAPAATAKVEDGAEDNDLRLYRLIIERVKRGDDYYSAATELQRQNNYPVAPGLTVRLPTLAFVSALLGRTGMMAAGFALLACVLIAMWRRLGNEPGGARFQMFGVAFLLVGLSTAIHPRYGVLHEVWAAEFMALSFALHRPGKGRWLGAVLAGAAALAVRELALPFVLLMGVSALWRRNWREAAAWALVVALFSAALAVHLHFAEAQIRPGDPVSPPWLVFGGLGGLLYKVIYSSSLSLLPVFIAGPVVILALFGWTGWKGAMGDFATLLTLGYGLAFMIAGRDNNFYWGVVLTPFLFMGMALVPFSARSLWQRAFGEPRHAG